MTKLSRA